jgi:Fe-S-cluster containining protein
MGESGAGKSTLAAWFHDRGYRVIADDVCVVRFDDVGSPRAVPGLPRLRLWAEALAKMGRDPSGLARSYVGADEEKYDVPIDREFAAGTDLPLTRLYVLDRASEFAISPVSGLPAAEAVFANTYRGWYASAAGTGQAHWQSAMNLVHKLPVVRVSRPWDLSLLDDQGMRLLDHVREQSKPRPAGSDGTARMNAIEQEPGSICVGCGLCCDGTLHGRATVKPDDEATVRAVALEIEEESGKRFFRQPCPRFSCGSCSVYAERPNVCRGYRCALLEKVDAGDIAAPDARATIERARQLVDRVRTATPEAITPEARAAAMDRLKAQVTLQGSDGDAAASALLDLAVLQHFLDRWFLKEKSEDSRPGERALG